MSRFLRFAVEESLAGRADKLKEGVIGVEVFDRPGDYDPRIDPIVRVEARRLRAKLRDYYQEEGRAETLEIEFPKGSYAPVFRQQGDPARPEKAREKTIAVLPFENLSTDADNEYFSDGLTQELIHLLTRVPSLQVMAWNSVKKLRDGHQRTADIGERFRLDAVLEGAVRRAGDRIRITAQLVDARTGIYLWSETYERELRDLFLLQQTLAQAIVTTLKLRLAGVDPVASPVHCASIEAYNLYLRGRFEWGRRSEEGLRKSLVFFDRAIEEDPHCALAFAGRADAHALLTDFGYSPVEEGVPRAREAALKALELEPTLAEPHVSLGYLASLYEWDWDRSERYYKRAIELNPGYATAHHWYGVDFLALLGRMEDAAREMSIARQLDPLEPVMLDSDAYVYLLWRKYPEAERRYRQLIGEWPDYHKAYTGLGRVLSFMGRYRESIEMFKKGEELAGSVPSLVAAQAQVHGAHGNKLEARRLLKKLTELSRFRHVPCVSMAIAHLGVGEHDAALDWLDRACEKRELSLSVAASHPAYDDLRGTPRFERVVKKVMGNQKSVSFEPPSRV